MGQILLLELFNRLIKRQKTLQPLRKLDGRRHRRMPFEMLKRIVEETAGKGLREIIPSTMGEPLLYEHFEGILALCAEALGAMDVAKDQTLKTQRCRIIGRQRH